jgi:hypothetical protein
MEKAEATVRKIKEEYHLSLPLPSQPLPEDQKSEFIGLVNQLWALAADLEPRLPKYYLLTKSDVETKALVAIVRDVPLLWSPHQLICRRSRSCWCGIRSFFYRSKKRNL